MRRILLDTRSQFVDAAEVFQLGMEDEVVYIYLLYYY